MTRSYAAHAAHDSREPRVALVTGAARGIGRATVIQLVEQGYYVVAVDVCRGSDHGLAGVTYALASKDELESLVDLAPGQIRPVVADVRDTSQLQRAVDACIERFRRLDVAVACAAVFVGSSPAWQSRYTPAFIDMWHVNVEGVRNLATSAVPAMLAGPAPDQCRFVAVASSAGLRGMYHLADYAMTKHAVIGYVRCLAADLAETGITATCVAPGGTDTAMAAASAEHYGVEVSELIADHALLRLLAPEEVAHVIVSAAHPLAAPLTGSVQVLDGMLH